MCKNATKMKTIGRAIVQAVSHCLPTAAASFEPSSGHVGFVVAPGQIFSEYFGFPYQFSFRRLLHIHHLSFGAGTIGLAVADVPSGLSLNPPKKIVRTN
jgi:hypothetical protein